MRLEAELGLDAGSWQSIWDDVERPARDATLQRQAALSAAGTQGRTLQHKRSTLEFILRGRMLGDASQMFSQAHRFEKWTYTTPAYCDFCSHVLWGLQQTG
jgi:myotubularin-related protein 5/13